jgi:hypothetical protein
LIAEGAKNASSDQEYRKKRIKEVRRGTHTNRPTGEREREREKNGYRSR